MHTDFLSSHALGAHAQKDASCSTAWYKYPSQACTDTWSPCSGLEDANILAVIVVILLCACLELFALSDSKTCALVQNQDRWLLFATDGAVVLLDATQDEVNESALYSLCDAVDRWLNVVKHFWWYFVKIRVRWNI